MLDLKQLPGEDKKSVAFQLVVAMRDTINLAKRKGHKPTYENAIRLFHDFSPKLYNDSVRTLPQRNLSEEAEVFIARAELQSKEQGKEIEPLALVAEEIEMYGGLLKGADQDDEEQKRVLRNKVSSFESHKKSLRPRTITENRILTRDASRASRYE